MKKLLRAVAVLASLATLPASAQTWDFTGNGKLSGPYVFRELISVPNAVGSITRLVTIYGTINFNGSGNYTLTGNVVDSAAGTGPYSASGTYSISASGYGFLRHPYANAGNIHGLVSNGIFIASSTENGINDLMIAVPAGSATNATFSGPYTLDYIQFVGNAQTGTYNTTSQLTANGNGGVGSVTTKSYIGGTNTSPVNVTINNVTSTFSNGIGTLRFPTSSSGNPPIRGDKTLYISQDGNFIFGGATNAWDFFVGVRRATGTPARMDGLYYSAGVNHLPSSFDTFLGALTARGTILLEHQRFLSTATAGGIPQNYTAAGVLPSNAVTDYTDSLSAVEYTVSQDASIRIGIGQAPYLGLRIAVRGPTFATTGVTPFIDPTGIVNSASFAPFTSGVAPGELVTIFGQNLASSTEATQGGVPFPKTLGGVRVWMNNREAAIYYVSPGQISAIVPYGTTEPVVEIRVERNGVNSNTVTAFRYVTHPGIFSQSQSGEGLGAVLHADYSLVTEQKPAAPGETIQVFLTGLGNVFPTVPDGGLGSTTDLNRTLPGTVGARVDNLDAEVTFSGLAPGLAGLYQVNLVVPAAASSGNVFLDIATPDAYTSQVALPVGVNAADPVRKSSQKPFVRRR